MNLNWILDREHARELRAIRKTAKLLRQTKALQAKQDRMAELKLMPYHRYLKTSHWRHLRGRVLRRARWTCAHCHGKATQVHHKTYARRGHEQLDDLEAVCGKCHVTEHHGVDFDNCDILTLRNAD